MDITPAPTKEQHLIQSYGAGRFVVRQKEIEENILIWPTGVELMGSHDLVAMQAPLLKNSINPLPELLIIGTGQWMLPLPVEARETFKKQGIKCEPMDTGAACRTYNVLVSEDRRVAAYLIAV